MKPNCQVGAESHLVCVPTADNLVSVRLNVPIFEIENSALKTKGSNAINALQAAIKAAQQVQTMAQLLRNNQGSAIVTAFKQQAASMGDHR